MSIIEDCLAADITDRKRAYIDGLRELTDWLAQNPEYVPEYSTVTINIFPADKGELAEFARAVGKAEKLWQDNWLAVRASFGPHAIDANLPREQVCRKVVTGKRKIPAKPARTEEIVEWVCDDPAILTDAA